MVYSPFSRSVIGCLNGSNDLNRSREGRGIIIYKLIKYYFIQTSKRGIYTALKSMVTCFAAGMCCLVLTPAMVIMVRLAVQATESWYLSLK